MRGVQGPTPPVGQVTLTLIGFLLDAFHFGLGTCVGGRHCFRGGSRFPGLASGAKFVKSVGTWAQMSAFVETTLVTDDFAWVKCRTTPTWGFGGVAVEAPATEVLGFLGCSIIGVHDRQGGMRIHVGGRVVEATRGTRAIKWGLSRYNNGGRVSAVNRVEFMYGRMRRGRCR